MAYKTLFYGLKRNQPHNAGPVHLILYVTRRVLFSFVIVLMATSGLATYLGLVMLLLTCVLMLALILMEAQWTDSLINWQHFTNEVVFYVLLATLICFTGIMTERR